MFLDSKKTLYNARNNIPYYKKYWDESRGGKYELLEIMAFGLLIISTNPDGIPYLINDGETGISVEKKDINAMVKGIKGLLNGSINAKKIVLDLDKEKVINVRYKTIDHFIANQDS